MADEQAPDTQWLLDRIPNATEDEQDYFAEETAKYIIDHEIPERRARIMALDKLNRWKKEKEN